MAVVTSATRDSGGWQWQSGSDALDPMFAV